MQSNKFNKHLRNLPIILILLNLYFELHNQNELQVRNPYRGLGLHERMVNH
jgi:hypothetical protein